MKTSNKLFIIAVGLIIAFLVVHDYALKAEYLKGAYKSPHYKMKNLALTNFNSIELKPPAGYTTININKGPEFSVWVSNDLEGAVFKNKGKALLISLNNEGDNWSEQTINITCPDLKSFTTKSVEKVYFPDLSTINIRGFSQDSMLVQTARSNTIYLVDCIIGKLNAGSNTTGGKLNVGPLNHIKEASFNIEGAGELRLYEPVGDEKRSYKLSPNAILTLSNNALKLFPH